MRARVGFFAVAGLLASLAGCPEYGLVRVSPDTLDFGDAQTELAITVSVAGSGSVRWDVTVERGGAWMSVSPESGEGNGTVKVSVDRSRMPEGESTGAVSIRENALNTTHSVIVKANRAKTSAPPVASFSAHPREGAAPLTVTFADESTCADVPVVEWAWDFGDGGISAEQNPSHTYSAAGEYTVSLTVTSASGSDTATDTVLVSDAGELPTANFEASPLTGTAPLTVQFTDRSQRGGAAITTWSWSFGDGAIGSGATANHVYTVPGVYTVTLVVTNRIGSDTEAKTGLITVTGLPSLKADFTATPVSGDAPLTVVFSDKSTPGLTPIAAWRWNFGDGQTSTDQNPTHVYANQGDYTVRLTVTDLLGEESVAEKANLISVGGPEQKPTAAFTATPLEGYAPLMVQFRDQSLPGDADISGWSWDFGDGSYSNESNPLHTYQNRGVYTVSLRVFSSIGMGMLTRKDYIAAHGVIGALEEYWPMMPGNAWTFAKTTDTPVGSATGTQTITIANVQSMEGYDVIRMDMNLVVTLGLFTLVNLAETQYLVESDGILYHTKEAGALQELPTLSPAFKPFLPTLLGEGDLDGWPYPAQIEAGEEHDFLPMDGQYSENILYTLTESDMLQPYADCAAWKSRDWDWGFSEMLLARGVGPVLMVRFGTHELLGDYEFPAPLVSVSSK